MSVLSTPYHDQAHNSVCISITFSGSLPKHSSNAKTHKQKKAHPDVRNYHRLRAPPGSRPGRFLSRTKLAHYCRDTRRHFGESVGAGNRDKRWRLSVLLPRTSSCCYCPAPNNQPSTRGGAGEGNTVALEQQRNNTQPAPLVGTKRDLNRESGFKSNRATKAAPPYTGI